MSTVGRRLRLGIAAIVLLPVIAGCTSSSDGPAPSTPGIPVAAPASASTVPQTAFCRALTGDIEGDVAAAYRAILPDAPPEIASDFQALIERLESGTTVAFDDSPTATAVDVTTTLSPDGVTLPEAEIVGNVPDDDPATRVFDYVQLVCRGVGNNPGPDATQPEFVPDPTTP